MGLDETPADGRFHAIWLTDGATAESPVWDNVRQRVYFADLKAGAIHRCDLRGEDRQQWTFDGRIGSFGLARSGRLVVALERRVVLFDPETQAIVPLTAELDEPAGNRFNDGKVGPDGAFWVGTRDARRNNGAVPDGNGGLYRVSADATMRLVRTGYATSNGLAWTPDGATMFHSDSHNGRLYAWDFDAAAGTASRCRQIAALSSEEGRPDGGACDAEGYYWSAGVSAGRLNRFDLDGTVVAWIKTPFPAPTMPCFGGDWLLVTANGRPHADPQYEYRQAGLFGRPSPVPGAPVDRFDG
jgi:sugar lactone lactonase YvrE